MPSSTEFPSIDKRGLLERLAAASSAQSTIVITPNARLAANLAQDFNSYQTSRGLSAWESADILPFGAWVERLHDDALYSDAGASLPIMLTPAEEQHVWQEVIEASEWGGVLLSGAQAAMQCRDSWQLAHAWRVAGALVPASSTAGSAWLGELQAEDPRAFASWSRAYAERTARDRRTDRARLPDVVATLLRESSGVAPLSRQSAMRKPTAVAVYAFDILTPQQRTFLAACAGAGMTVERSQPQRSEASVSVRLALASAREELECAARWARHRLESAREDRGAENHEPPRIAVVVPDLEARRKEVQRVFARALDPAWNLPVNPAGGEVRRAAPLFNISLGEPLSSFPVVDAALTLLELCGGEVDYARIGRLLRSPFIVAAEAELGARACLDAALRERVPPRLRMPALLAALTRALDPEHAAAPPCPRLMSSLGRVFELARDTLHGAHSPQEWARRYSGLLLAAGFPGERSLDSAEYQTLAKWQEMLGELSRLERVAPRLTHAQALARLRRLCLDTLFQPRASTEGITAPIQVLGILESAGMEFDHLWVSGLTEDAWPLAARPDPFIPLALQKKAGMPQSSAESSLALDARITADWQRSAGEVVFSHPLAEADRILLPSPLIARLPLGELEALGLPAKDSLRDRVFMAGRNALETFTDHTAPTFAKPESGGGTQTNAAGGIQTSAAGGTAVLANQAACPFRAFARHRLAADPLEAPVAGLDAAARGQLLHALFARIWGELKSKAGLDDVLPEQLHAIIGAAAEYALSRLRAARPDLIGERYAALELQRLARLAMDWLEVESGRPGFEVIAREDARSLTAGGLTLRGRIDRMDRLEDGSYALIDYKTGRASPSGWLGPRPDDPQLPLYAVNAGENIGAVSFARLRTGDMRFDGISRASGALPGVAAVENHRTAKWVAADWQALLTGWRAELDALGRGFVAGDARVSPKYLLKTCDGCGLKPLCRVHERFAALVEAESPDGEAANDGIDEGFSA